MYRAIALATLLTVSTPSALADGLNGDAVLDGAVGGGAGAAVGSMAGGRDGAIIGSALGAAAGTAIATRHQPRVVYVADEHHHDNGLHRGWYKHKHRNRHHSHD